MYKFNDIYLVSLLLSFVQASSYIISITGKWSRRHTSPRHDYQRRQSTWRIRGKEEGIGL